MKFTDHNRHCHAERSEASRGPANQTLRCAQGDTGPVMLSAAKHLASLHMCIFMGINFWNIEKYVILTHSDIMRQSQDWMLALCSFDAEAFPPAILVNGIQRRQ